MLHQVGDLFELNVKLPCQKVKEDSWNITALLPIIQIKRIIFENFREFGFRALFVKRSVLSK